MSGCAPSLARTFVHLSAACRDVSFPTRAVGEMREVFFGWCDTLEPFGSHALFRIERHHLGEQVYLPGFSLLKVINQLFHGGFFTNNGKFIPLFNRCIAVRHDH